MGIYGIDMGHSLSGAGTGASNILNEVTENRRIGNELIKMLQEKGHTVVNCTVDSANSTNEQLKGIVAKANAQSLDRFLSIHLNAGGGIGTETYTLTGASQNSIDAAKNINELVVNSCGFRNRGLKSATYYVLRNTNASAILVEICFVDSQEDASKINPYNIAKALFKGLTGSDYIENITPPVVAPPTNPTPPVVDEEGKKQFFRIIAGSYSDRNNAEAQRSKLADDGYSTFLSAFEKDGATFFRVVVGSYTVRENADIVVKELTEKGYSAFIDIFYK